MMQEIDDSNWKVINDEDDKIKVVDFYATWCGPCKVVGAFLESLSEEMGGENIEFYKANVEDCVEASDTFGIRNVPTLIFLKNGEVIDKMIGMGNKERIRKLIKDSQK